MDSRELKALEIAARMRVVRDGDAWSVPSQTGGAKYRVDPVAPLCSCADFDLRRQPCKHILAVRLVIDREAGTEPVTPVPDPDAEPRSHRPTYGQDWRAYNRAQRGEKHRFQVLLADLCRGVPDPPRAKTGRKPVPMADAVLAAVFKVYTGFSSRRFGCDLDDAHAAGHLSRPIHPNKVNCFMENPDLTPVLHGLIVESARPLAAVECDFAADSSGFMTSRFVKWFDHKYGVERTKHGWVKCHLMCGVKTNVVTAVVIGDRDASDTKQLPELVGETARNFLLREVSADKGYGSLSNYDVIEKHGATPFIAFKSIHTGAGGGLWERMYHLFQYRRDEFLSHYHKRSNVESTFSAVKRKLGDSVRSKTDVSMANEVLCKLLAYNLTVLIHEQEELGIAPEFWDDARDEDPGIIRFPGTRRA